MTPQFSKGQRVRVAATKFDNENRDNGGMNFSERWWQTEMGFGVTERSVECT